jgi:hypothetical protein
MVAFINSIINARTALFDIEYVGLATEIKCLGRLDVEIMVKHILMAAILDFRPNKWLSPEYIVLYF